MKKGTIGFLASRGDMAVHHSWVLQRLFIQYHDKKLQELEIRRCNPPQDLLDYSQYCHEREFIPVDPNLPLVKLVLL